VSLFLPELGQVVAGGAVVPSTAPVIVGNGEKFVIRVGKEDNGTDPVVLKQYRGKANVSLEIIGQNIEPTWRLTLDLEGEPKLSFWKLSEERGLSAIPSKRLHYTQQILFHPYGNGDKIKIPVEISGIKEENCELIFKIETKKEKFEKRIPVRFVPE
jgi:hypothetical protein